MRRLRIVFVNGSEMQFYESEDCKWSLGNDPIVVIQGNKTFVVPYANVLFVCSENGGEER